MRDLANGHFSEDLLKLLWLRRLPGNIQAILAASNETLPQLATMADKIHELTIINHMPISQQEQFSISNPIEKQIQELTLQVNELATLVQAPRYQHRPRYNFRNRQDSHGRSPSCERHCYKESEGGLCFYHTNFANVKKMHPTLFIPKIGKLDRQLPVATESKCQVNRIFMAKPSSKLHFLVDTGADISVIPKKFAAQPIHPGKLTLYAANGTQISTYKTRLLTINLNLR
ncbi:uncharacterized protein LOC111626483 [Centruroides sculpturatus]|uniref:uncharacterized protein LOC111626483 n=1 Tax=Centruroides sculpturatus TaxID=218467 RepID=UPI000C6D762F|nr:uncharacterized protein LOC111626483 [Centruroides sculpturatus]